MSIQICNRLFQPYNVVNNDICMIPSKSVKKTHQVVFGEQTSASVVNAPKPQAQQPWLIKLGNALSDMQQWVISYVTSSAEEPLYIQAQGDVTFRTYAKWHQSLAQSLADGLMLSTPPCNLLSPMAYAMEIERLEHSVSKMMLSKVRELLCLELQSKRDINELFMADIEYAIILLSGRQISSQSFLNSFRVYEKAFDKKIYDALSLLLEDFIRKYQLEEIDHEGFILSKTKNRVYQNLLANLKASLVTKIKVQPEKNYTHRSLRRCYNAIQCHPYLFLAMTAACFGKSTYTSAKDLNPVCDLASFNASNYEIPYFQTYLFSGINTEQCDYSLRVEDINGDEIADLAINNRYVVYGSPRFNLSELNGGLPKDFVIMGTNKDDQFGYSISSGDMNGDESVDVLLGAYDYKGRGNYVLRAYDDVSSETYEADKKNNILLMVLFGASVTFFAIGVYSCYLRKKRPQSSNANNIPVIVIVPFAWPPAQAVAVPNVPLPPAPAVLPPNILTRPTPAAP